MMSHRYALAAVMLAAFALPAAAQQTTPSDTSKKTTTSTSNGAVTDTAKVSTEVAPSTGAMPAMGATPSAANPSLGIGTNAPKPEGQVTPHEAARVNVKVAESLANTVKISGDSAFAIARTSPDGGEISSADLEMNDGRLVYQVKMLHGAQGRVRGRRRRHDGRDPEGQEVRWTQGAQRACGRDPEAAEREDRLLEYQEALTHRRGACVARGKTGASSERPFRDSRNGRSCIHLRRIRLSVNVVASTLVLLAAVANVAIAQPLRIAYRVAMPDPASHLYDVSIDVGGVRGDTLPLQLPVWSPGRYARMDFARNVQEFRATDDGGRTLRWDKTNGSRWVVLTGGAHDVHLRYRVFANALSGTFSVLDSAHANWNGAALFMYVEGHKPDPVTLDIVAPAGWHVINGDTRSADQTRFRFENYDRLIDTPDRSRTGGDARFVRRRRTPLPHDGAPQRPRRIRHSRTVRARRREDRALRELGLRAAAARAVHVPVQHRLSGRRWDGASLLHADHQPHALAGLARGAAGHLHGGARVLPRLEREARASRRARPVRLHARAVPAEPLGRRRMDAVLRARRTRPRGHRPHRRVLRDDGWTDPDQPHGTGPQGSLGAHGVVPRAILGRRRAAAAQQRIEHLLLVLHQGRGARALPRSLAAREDGQPTLARRRVRIAQASELERTDRRRTTCRAEATRRPTSSARRARSPARTCTAGSSGTSVARRISTTTRCSRGPACGSCAASDGRSRRCPMRRPRSSWCGGAGSPDGAADRRAVPRDRDDRDSGEDDAAATIVRDVTVSWPIAQPRNTATTGFT